MTRIEISSLPFHCTRLVITMIMIVLICLFLCVFDNDSNNNNNNIKNNNNNIAGFQCPAIQNRSK